MAARAYDMSGYLDRRRAESDRRAAAAKAERSEAGRPSLDLRPKGVRKQVLGPLRKSEPQGPLAPPCAKEAAYLECQGRSCGALKLVPVTCKRRTCPNCAHVRFVEQIAKYRDLQPHLERPRFLTVTLRNSHNLEGAFAWLQTAWKSFRSRPEFKTRVKGGFYAFEIQPPSGKRRGWNVHIHALIDAAFIPQELLSALWLEETGDSRIVHIQNTKSPKSAVAYCLGYSMEGKKVKKTWGSCPPDVKSRYEACVKGKKLISTFGHLYGKGLPPPPMVCECCAGTIWKRIFPDHAEIDAWERAGFVPEWSRGPPLPPSPQTAFVTCEA